MHGQSTLFAYGSLMFPEVWMQVVGRGRESVEATLAGHTAFTVHGYSFPGLVPTTAPEATTPGRLYFDLSCEDWRRLDEFEDTFYHRLPVDARTSDGQCHAAAAYIVDPAEIHVLSETVWDSERFARQDLSRFVERAFGSGN